ncbi:MAG TPA: hypothetical protein VEC76_00260 [Streptosporangiaceae bacterium]|nr:hypothetical protein [Streptosporangiaceae bacterium]
MAGLIASIELNSYASRLSEPLTSGIGTTLQVLPFRWSEKVSYLRLVWLTWIM